MTDEMRAIVEPVLVHAVDVLGDGIAVLRRLGWTEQADEDERLLHRTLGLLQRMQQEHGRAQGQGDRDDWERTPAR